MTMEDLKNECKWSRGSRIPGMAGNKKGAAECGRKEFCRTDKQCGRCKTTYIYCLYENG
jgi:hypothetical protein